jgi:hypothetical protein
MNFVHGWFLSPGSNHPTQSRVANGSLPKKIGTRAFRESNAIEERQ